MSSSPIGNEKVGPRRARHYWAGIRPVETTSSTASRIRILVADDASSARYVTRGMPLAVARLNGKLEALQDRIEQA